MEEKVKHYLEKTLWIMEWIIRFYIVLAIVLLIHNFYSHPELYNIVKERPIKADISNEINLPGIMNNNEVIPEYMYHASTTEECKPLVSLYKFYNNWLRPLFYLVVLYYALLILSKIDFAKYIKLEDKEEKP